jgi:hypothetical protein
MDAYIYNADIYCDDCTHDIMAGIMRGTDTGDSSDYPQGPFDNGGGEADCPQHCGACGVFLENPLTADGYDYVREALADGTGDSDVLAEWRAFYDYLGDDDDDDE